MWFVPSTFDFEVECNIITSFYFRWIYVVIWTGEEVSFIAIFFYHTFKLTYIRLIIIYNYFIFQHKEVFLLHLLKRRKLKKQRVEDTYFRTDKIIVLVVVPVAGAIWVREGKRSDPLFPSAVASSFCYNSGHSGRGSKIYLEPLSNCGGKINKSA